MSAAQQFLPPVIVLIGLSFLTALTILFTRMADLVQRKLPLSYYEDFNGGDAPTSVIRPTRQLANQFEFPVLFYTLIAFIVALDLSDPLLVALAWAYVALRWAHGLSHIWLNHIYIRTPLFMFSNIVLLVMWGRFVFDVLG